MNLVVLAFLNGQREWADARQRRRKPFPLTITTFGSVCNHALALHTAGNMACKGMIVDRPKVAMLSGDGFRPRCRVSAQSAHSKTRAKQNLLHFNSMS